MADDKKTVRKELLATSMYLNGRDMRRGDLVDLDEEQAKRLEDAGMVADEGHLAKLEKEREQADKAAADREAEAVRISDEEAQRRQAHDADQLAADSSSGDGPRTTRRNR